MRMANVVYRVRRDKHLRRLCKLSLNLAILSLLGFLVWFGLRLFTGAWGRDPLLGGLVFVCALTMFIYLSRLGLRSRWRPSMRLTVVSLVALFLIFSFAGVQPLTGYKDTMTASVRGLVARIGDTVAVPDLSPAVYVESTYLDYQGGNRPFRVIFSVVPSHALPDVEYRADFYVRGKLRDSQPLWFSANQIDRGFAESIDFYIYESDVVPRGSIQLGDLFFNTDLSGYVDMSIYRLSIHEADDD